MDEIANVIACRGKGLVEEGFFASLGALNTYVASLKSLHENPDRGDLAWSLGIDADILDEKVRLLELSNWIENKVL